MAKAPYKKKKPKKFQFQMGWGGMLAFTTATLCILLWVFVLGFWAGKRFSGTVAPSASNQVGGVLQQGKPELSHKKQGSSLAHEEEADWPAPWGNMESEEQKPVPEVTIGEEENQAAPAVKKAEQQVEEKIEKLKKKLRIEPQEKQAVKTASKPQEKKSAPPKAKEKKKVVKKEPVKKQSPFFALQIASYKQKSRAEKEAARWRKKGYEAMVKRVNLGIKKGIWYRVYVGHFETPEKAKSAAERLAKREGLRAYVVPVRP